MILDIIKKDIDPLNIKDEGIYTLSIMDEYKVNHLPVINSENELLGLINESAILNMEDLQKSIKSIKNKLHNIYIYFDEHIFKAIQIITEKQLTLIPVINKEYKYVGYIKAVDVVTKIGTINVNQSNMCILIITANENNYMLSEISRLIEENNGKVLSLFTEFKDTKININIMISCSNAERIIQALERYDYNISNKFINQPDLDNLDDRFESFIKFLNP